jgi:hypothetical protein
MEVDAMANTKRKTKQEIETSLTERFLAMDIDAKGQTV